MLDAFPGMGNKDLIQICTADPHLAGQLFYFYGITEIMLQIFHSLAEIKLLQRPCRGGLPGRSQQGNGHLLLIHAGKQKIEIPHDFQQILAVLMKTVFEYAGLGQKLFRTFLVRGAVNHLSICKSAVLQQSTGIRAVKCDPAILPGLFFIRDVLCSLSGKD